MQQYNVTLVQPGDDLDSIAELIHEAIEDVSYCGITKVDAETIMDAVVDHVFSPIDSKTLFVLYAGAIPVGVLVGAVNNSHPIFSQVKVVTELFWYVLPEHRGNRASLGLIEAYETWARKIGASFVSMGHFHDDLGERLEKVYKKMGYTPLEHTYIKKL